MARWRVSFLQSVIEKATTCNLAPDSVRMVASAWIAPARAKRVSGGSHRIVRLDGFSPPTTGIRWGYIPPSS